MKRILLVDDSLTVRMQLKEAFENAGLATSACSTLATARDILSRDSFALVVLDVMLPDGDGIALLSELRASPASESTPVMILSSEIEVRDRVRGLRTGATEYVGKPYDLDYVLSRATELIRKSEGARPPSAEVTVLVIDDSAAFRAEARGFLESEGFRVLLAASGEEGIRIAVNERPNALVIDLLLPGVDGANLVRRLRLDPALRLTPCVLLTASQLDADEVKGLEAGADAYLKKDDDLSLLAARLRALLRSTGSASPGFGEGSAMGTKKILSVDDSMTFQSVLADQLREEGYDLISVRSGEEAIEILTVQRVDCILLDLEMPGISGFETCRLLKARPRNADIPVIILSSHTDREAMIEGFGAGAVDYVVKSDDFEGLKQRIRVQLRRQAFEEENRRAQEQLLRHAVEAEKARTATALAETRASLLAALEQKNTELAEAKEAVEIESRFKSKFLAGMSHELRTPLNAIIGFSELLAQRVPGPLTEKQERYVDNVLQSGRHLLSLVNDILDIARVESGRTVLAREWFAVHEIAESVRAVLVPIAEKQAVRLEVDLSPSLPGLHADPVRIRQVLYNLISNGIKFTPSGGLVSLGGAQVGEWLEIVVRDSGVGISEQDLPRLFCEFERVGDPTRTEGTGLGLVLAKNLVELHGGTIAVASQIGQGTTFTVRLPLGAAESAR